MTPSQRIQALKTLPNLKVEKLPSYKAHEASVTCTRCGAGFYPTHGGGKLFMRPPEKIDPKYAYMWDPKVSFATMLTTKGPWGGTDRRWGDKQLANVRAHALTCRGVIDEKEINADRMERDRQRDSVHALLRVFTNAEPSDLPTLLDALALAVLDTGERTGLGLAAVAAAAVHARDGALERLKTDEMQHAEAQRIAEALHRRLVEAGKAQARQGAFREIGAAILRGEK